MAKIKGSKNNTKRIKWKYDVKKLSELKRHPKNPRKIDDNALKKLEESFDEIGMAQPINISKNNVILSGHARVRQLKREGQKEVQVMVAEQDLTPKQEEAVIVRMNRNIVGEWDEEILKTEFDVENLYDWGFTRNDLKIFDVGNESKTKEVNSGDENSEWSEMGMPEFVEGDRYIKLILHFKTEEQRHDYVQDNNIKIDMRNRNTWISHVEK